MSGTTVDQGFYRDRKGSVLPEADCRIVEQVAHDGGGGSQSVLRREGLPQNSGQLSSIGSEAKRPAMRTQRNS